MKKVDSTATMPTSCRRDLGLSTKSRSKNRRSHIKFNQDVGKDLANQEFIECVFDGLNLRDTRFDGSLLYGCSFQGVNLDGASFEKATVFRSDFRGANFFGATITLNCATFDEIKLDDVAVASLIWLLTTADVHPETKQKLMVVLKSFDRSVIAAVHRAAKKEER